jgi:hypothetical protein
MDMISEATKVMDGVKTLGKIINDETYSIQYKAMSYFFLLRCGWFMKNIYYFVI